MRKVAWFILVSSILATVAELCGMHLPSISWAYNLSHKTSWLHSASGDGAMAGKVAWFGYIVSVIGVALSALILARVPAGRPMLPTTKVRLQRFKANTRGFVSFIIIVAMVILAGLDQVVVGKKALFVQTSEGVSFPAFSRKVYTGKDFGETGDLASAEMNYRNLKGKEGFTVVMPLVPYDPTQDTVKVPYKVLEENDGLLMGMDGKPMNGSASTLFNGDSESRHMIFEYREGIKKGLAIGRKPNGEPVYEARYEAGVLVAGSEDYKGEGMSKEEFLASGGKEICKVLFHASPPGGEHLLGTTPLGSDMLAYLYGGLQVNIKAALIYIPMIYIIGVTLGLLMGFFGGAFDLIFQRIIEIFSTIPFLFVVIIFSSMVDAENRGLAMILGILILFGWMGMTYLMRTAAMKEKARDYVAAARVSGASTSRIIFTHILPNTVAILVTLVPFSVSGIVMSLTALDYLGFGLPSEYATWGTLLKDGLGNFSKPWLVTSSFTALVTTLILVTFVGEAVRDAFDPKKFTTYK
ncbi:MAG: ABC transporter permease subunit [Rubritalea sp.]|uniref:ABC transporter permease subunit n=1 Tax=Rubritalea sp. TaxID=2109375 RepID=UPI0032424E6F